MSILTLTGTIGLIAIIFTLILKFSTGHVKVLWLSILQNFCGILFIFSGWVKAIDPMGTAFKMEQYFAEFEATFSATSLSFLAPLFPWLSSLSVGFSVFMIIIEIVLGVMLILGYKKKLTAWLFFLIVFFFTFLTGYVPADVNFFSFGQWGPYVETNMKVTDCGCFGDFIKLKPKVSFIKDIFLMVPAILFLFYYAKFHELFKPPVRLAITFISLFVLFLYCLNNFYWNEPHIDFRPFREGVNIREQKAAEEDAMANVDVTLVMKNKADGRIVEMPQDQYMKEFKSYPKEEWEFLDPIKSEPSVAQTKISEFMVEDKDGNEVGEEILAEEGYSFIFIAYKFKGSSTFETREVSDTTFRQDTIVGPEGDTTITEVPMINTTDQDVEVFEWNPKYLDRFRNSVNELATAAMKDEHKVFGIVGSASREAINDIKIQAEIPFDFYKADDILLKTIQRSNPGLLLMKDGLVVKKWHHRHMPDYETLKKDYIK